MLKIQHNIDTFKGKSGQKNITNKLKNKNRKSYKNVETTNL